LSKDDDDMEDRVRHVDEFLHSLFSVIGACLDEGDDAEVTVNGIRIMTFLASPIEQVEEIEQHGSENVFDLAHWRPTGEKN